MPFIQDIIRFLEEFAPPDLAEDWDNVGLLLGDAAGQAKRAMTCLTLTPDVAAEAIDRRVDFIVSHHPILFRAVQRITADEPAGAMLLELIRANVAVYSPHTALDSAAAGINTQLAARLGLRDPRPLRPFEDASGDAGTGRMGELSEPAAFEDFLRFVLTSMKLPGCESVATDREVRRVALACGSAAEFLSDAAAAECDVFITGEARFHAALEARSNGIGMILLGHYASERFALESLAARLSGEFPALDVWASEAERDPLQYVAAG